MKAKQLITLAAITAILAALAVWSTKKEARQNDTGLIGLKILPGLEKQLNDAATIRIMAPAATVTVSRIDGVWRMPAKWNYPANFGKVRDVLGKLADLKTLQSIRTTPAERAELQLLTSADTAATNHDQCATLIQVMDGSGKVISSLYLGKTRSRPAQEPGMGGFPDSRYVMTAEGRASLVADTLPEVVPVEREWLDNDFLNVSDILSLHITGSTNGEIRAERTTPGDELKLAGDVPAGKEVDSAKLSQLGAALNYLRFDDVADPKLSPSQTGLDKPIVYEALTKKGEKFTLRIGSSPAGDTKRYATVSASFVAPIVPVPSGSDTNQAALARARDMENAATAASVKALNDKLSPWIYLLGQYNAEAMAQGFKDLLKEKAKPQDEKESATNAGDHHDN